MTNFFAQDENNSGSLIEQIRRACEGLEFVSESDSPIVPFFRSRDEQPIKETLSDASQEVPFEAFFEKLTEDRDWYGDREKKIAKRFGELQKLLEENLRDLKVLRSGQVQIDIYVIGTDSDGNTAGFQTKAVET